MSYNFDTVLDDSSFSLETASNSCAPRASKRKRKVANVDYDETETLNIDGIQSKKRKKYKYGLRNVKGHKFGLWLTKETWDKIKPSPNTQPNTLGRLTLQHDWGRVLGKELHKLIPCSFVTKQGFVRAPTTVKTRRNAAYFYGQFTCAQCKLVVILGLKVHKWGGLDGQKQGIKKANICCHKGSFSKRYSTPC